MDPRDLRSLLLLLVLALGCSETTTPPGTDAQTPTDAVVTTDLPQDRPQPADLPLVTDRPERDGAQFDAPGGDVLANDVPTSEAGSPDAMAGRDGGAGPCPAERPEANTGCTREGLACQYGSDPRESCRVTASCERGQWQVTTPRCPPIVDPAMCPASREVAAGAECQAREATCDYAGLGCTCTNCRSFPVGGCAGPLRWRCTAPNLEPGCPAVQPNLGTACARDGQRCGYDCEATGVQGGRICREGTWQVAPNNCPISSRAAKRDIRYLSRDEATEIARQALRTRLATYEYSDPALRGPRRLGFVYEDATTPPFARNPDISGVDLYGYTSMLLATVQQQQREIVTLRRAVEALQRRAPRPARGPRPRD